MPFLVTAPQSQPASAPLVRPDQRRLEFESLDGQSAFPFDANVFITDGLEGIDVPPRAVAETGGGAGLPRLDTIRDAPADMMLPLLLLGDYRDSLGQLARLRRFFDVWQVDYRRTDGTFDLVAYDDGGARRRRCFYTGGLEGRYDDSSRGPGWMVRGLDLRSVWPYWRGETWTTGVVRLPVATPFLSAVGASPFGQQRLASSLVLGADMDVFVPGEVPSPAVVSLLGPLTSATITSSSGLRFKVGALGEGDHLLIDTGRDRRVVLNGGAVNSGSALIGRGAQWEPLSPGRTTVTFNLLGATPLTTAEVYGEALYQSPWASEYP